MPLGSFEGLQSAQVDRQIDVSRDAQKVRERQIGLAEKTAMQQQAQERAVKTLNVINQLVDNTHLTGGDMAKTIPATREMLKGLGPMVERGLLDPAILEGQYNAIIGKATPQQVAEQAAVKAALTKQRETEAVDKLGLENIAAETKVVRGLAEDPANIPALQGGGHLPANVKPAAPQIQNMLMPDGSKVAFDVSTPQGAVDMRAAIANGGLKFGVNVTPATIGDITDDKRLIREVIAKEAGTRDVISIIARVNEQVEDKDVKTGFASGLIRGLDSIAGNMQQLAGEIASQDSALLDPSRYNLTGFGPEAAASAAFKGNITNLAYAMARAADPGGRLSDKDVQLQIDRFAANSGSKGQIKSAMAEVERFARDSYLNFHTSASRQKNVGAIAQDLLPKTSGSGDSGDSGGLPRGVEIKSAKMKDGTIRQFIKIQGKWLPLEAVTGGN